MPPVRAPQTTSIVQLSDAAYADLGNALAISFLGASPYTFEGWFLFQGLCPDSTLLEKSGEFVLGTKGATVYAQRTGQLYPIVTPRILNTTDWFHIAVTFDGATMSLYVDGLLSVSTTSPGPGIAGQGNPFKLGPALQGQIDSFRIWNYARSQTQIYEAQWLTLVSQNGLLAEYDCTRTPPVDVSGNGNPITLRAGAVSVTITPAVRVIGTGYCEPIDDATAVNPGGAGSDPYSIIAWIDLDVVDGLQTIFANGDLSLPSGVYLSVTDGIVMAQRGGSAGTTLASVTKLVNSQWYCIGYSYDGATQSIYINGVLDSSGAAGPIPTMAQGDLTIAAAFNSQSAIAVNSLQGYIQFISVWNICLTAAQMTAWMYHNPTDQAGVVANYSFASASATNLQTTNPVGLAAGAALVQLTTASSSGNVAERKRDPAKRGVTVRSLTGEEVEERSAFFDADRRRALLDEFRRALPGHMPRAERAAAIAALSGKLDALADPDNAAGEATGVRYTVVVSGDEWSFLRSSASGVVELQRVPLAELSPCAAAVIVYVLAAFDLFLGLVGLKYETSVATQFFNIRIGEGGFTTAIQAILSLPLTARSVLAVISILWDFGWFTSAIQLAISGMTWWDWITLTARVASMLVPYPTFQKAYATAQLVIGLWEVSASYLAAQRACD